MTCQLLHRIDPDLNMARFYRVEVTPDLFGQVIVERRWGRIGGRGQYLRASYPSTSSAEQAASALVRAKEKRGYSASD
jgi:predicted DNA-binding WGR domain protein